MEDAKLPRAQLLEGRLYIEGEEEPYIQGAIRHLWLTVRKLQYYRTFEINEDTDSDKVRQGGRIQGLATIEQDTLTVAGSGLPKVREIPFSVRGLSEDGAKHHWRMSVGFLPHDWELPGGDEYYCECYAPEPVFSELVKAYLAGKAVDLKVGANTNLWIREYDWHAPPSSDVTWYLVPSTGERQSDMPDSAYGKITHFSWSDRPTENDPPANEGDEPTSPDEVVDPTATYRAAHLASLGKTSQYLLAIAIALLILAAIELLRR
jgi:hypothetical protein